MQRNADGVSIRGVLLQRLSVHSTRGKHRQRETHVWTPSFPVRWKTTQHWILTDVRAGTLFGIIEFDIPVPEELRSRFAEMQPVFKNITLTRDDLGPFMRRYAEDHDILTRPRCVLVGSFRGDKILLGTPLLRWYMGHGPGHRVRSDSVPTARREGDAYPHKTIVADTMKLLGHSGYGKTITNVDRHRDVKYCTEVGASSMINDRRFRQLDRRRRRTTRTRSRCTRDP